MSINITHGHHFVEMLRRGVSGTSALIGQTRPGEADFLVLLPLCFATEQERKEKEKEKC